MPRAHYSPDLTNAINVLGHGARGDGRVDDGPAIQAALDTARLRGGGKVLLPAGTYRIGTPADGSPGLNNQPLFIGSNVQLIGEGPGETVLRLADEVRQVPGNLLFEGFGYCASMILNWANPWWTAHWGPSGLREPDRNIVIANMTLDGNKDGQSSAWRRGNQTGGRVVDPLPGQLSAIYTGPDPGGPTRWIRLAVTYTDVFGNESTHVGSSGLIAIDPIRGYLDISLPPTPENAQHLVVYVAKIANSDGHPEEADYWNNTLYRRLGPMPIPRFGEHLLLPTSTLQIGPADKIPPGTRLNPAGSGACNGIFFGQLSNCLLCNLDIRDFSLDAITLQGVRYPETAPRGIYDFRVENVHMRRNARWGVVLDGPAERVHFQDCILEDNAAAADIAEAGHDIRQVRFSMCQFRNNKVTIQPKHQEHEGRTMPVIVADISFTGCTFDGPVYSPLGLELAPDGGQIQGVRLQGCTFQGVRGVAVDVRAGTAGVIEGCGFDENGAMVLRGFYASQIRFMNSFERSSWVVSTNRFRPPSGCHAAAIWPPSEEPSAVAVTNNFFERNPNAPEATLLPPDESMLPPGESMGWNNGMG